MNTLRLKIPEVRSLCWSGDALVDWVVGGRVLHLDGRIEERSVYFAYRFDAAITSADGEFAVIYEKLGTKGLVLHRGKMVREINRSFYHANVYEYPVAFFRARNGRMMLAHCPDEYCRLELEDAETGERVGGPRRKPPDFFHSRLRVSPNGRWLLSAGWVWHPFGMVEIFDLEKAMRSADALDRGEPLPKINGEVAAAEFLEGDRLLVSTSDEVLDEPESETEIQRNTIAVVDVARRQVVSQVPTSVRTGTLMPVSTESAVGFFEYPKLISLCTGEVLTKWQEIPSGKQNSCIIFDDAPLPPIATDAARRRFAVADGSTVHVVDLNGFGETEKP